MFQSTPPHGRRLPPQYAGTGTRRFQSTPPHGRRLHRGQSLCGHRARFNPRLRTGGDWHAVIRENSSQYVSIHASAREATTGAVEAAQNIVVSIHASAREATIIRTLPAAPHDVSIHASAREATRVSAVLPAGRPVSIHASAREATIWVAEGKRYNFPFQSTPPHGRRL